MKAKKKKEKNNDCVPQQRQLWHGQLQINFLPNFHDPL